MPQDLAEEYLAQWQLRAWDIAFQRLPDFTGHKVLDLGCAVGDQAALFARGGTEVVGVDANPKLLAVAESKKLGNCRFVNDDLATLQVAGRNGPFDGIWSSFAPAYFTNFGCVLDVWLKLLRPGGWIALVEVSKMFDHSPLAERHREMIRRFYKHSRENELYDYEMATVLRPLLVERGVRVDVEQSLPDEELSKQGPLSDLAVASWQRRMQRMTILREFVGDKNYEDFCTDFFSCLNAVNHSTKAIVTLVVGRRCDS